MALSGYDLAAAGGAPYPFRVAVEILAEGGTAGVWCDINKPKTAAAADKWVSRLVSLPTISLKSEVAPGRFAATISNLILKDDDSLFGKLLPWTLYATSGQACTLPSWYHRQVRIRVGHHVGNSSAWVWVTLGIFMIEEIARDPKTRCANMKLVGREKLLIDLKASDIKRGDSWLCNVPIPDLVRFICAKVGEQSDQQHAPFAITFESGSPPADCAITTTDEVVSRLGNCPPSAAGEWVDHSQVVPRYIFSATAGTIIGQLYLCGYHAKTGKAALAIWDREGTGQWTTYELTSALPEPGWEVVYGVQGTGVTYPNKLWLFAICNESTPQDSYSAVNNRLCVIRVDPATGAVEYASTLYHVWPCQHYLPENVTDPSIDCDVWGNLPGYGNLYVNPQIFFRSMISGASRATVEVSGFSGSPNSETGLFEPDRMLDARENSDGSQRALYPHAVEPGFYTCYAPANHVYDTFTLRVANHGDPSEGFKYSTAWGKVFWLSWWANGYNSGYWYLYYLNTGTGSILSSRMPYGSLSCVNGPLVTCFDVDIAADGTGWIYTGTVDVRVPNVTPKLYKHEFVPVSMTVPTELTFANNALTFDSARRYCPVLISMRVHQDGPIWGSVLNVHNTGGPSYGLWFWASATVNAVFNNGGTNPLPMSTCPFAFSRGTQYQDLRQTWYMQDQATGTVWPVYLWVMGGNADLYTSAPISAGEPVDGENCWCSSNLYWDSGYSKLFGSSASESPADCRMPFYAYGNWPGNYPPIASYTPGGRLTLWQWAASLSDVIPVADFGEENCWDALEMCRDAAGNYIMGFGKAGTFQFVKRQSAGDPVVTFCEVGDQPASTSGTHALAAGITSRLDYARIANSFTIPIYSGEVGATEITAILTPDSRADSVAITAQNTSAAARRVALRCIRSGKAITDEASTDSVPLLFAWTQSLDDLTTTLSLPAPSTDWQIHVYGLHEDDAGLAYLQDSRVRLGDTCKVADGNVRNITTIDADNGIIGLDGTIGDTTTHPIGATVTITPRAGSAYADSVEGVCSVAASFSLVGATAATLTVDSTDRLRPGMVLYRDTAYVQVLEVIDATNVRVLKQVLGTSMGQTNTWAVGDILRGAIWIQYAGRSYAISDTGLSIALTPQTKDVYLHGAFSEGDRIVITCPGLQVKKIEHAIYRCVNSASVALHGRRDYRPQVENRLMTLTRARVLMSADEPHLAWPRWTTRIERLPLLFGLDIGDYIGVTHEYLFPEEADYSTYQTITGIEWNLAGGYMNIDAQASGTSSRGRAAAIPTGLPHPRHARTKHFRYGGA